MKDTSFFPTTIQLHPTNRCNLNCYFCGSRRYYSQSSPELPDHLFIEWVAEAIENGVKRITIAGGGEPLVRRDLVLDIISQIKRGEGGEDIRGEIITNGTLINDEVARKLVELRWNLVEVSMNASNADLDERIRKVPGAFARTIRGLERITAYKKQFGSALPEIAFIIVMTQYNYHDVPSIVALAQKYGVTGISLKLENTLDAKNLMSDPHFREEFSYSIIQTLSLANRLQIETIIQFDLPEGLIDLHEEERRPLKYTKISHDIPLFDENAHSQAYPWLEGSKRPKPSPGQSRLRPLQDAHVEWSPEAEESRLTLLRSLDPVEDGTVESVLCPVPFRDMVITFAGATNPCCLNTHKPPHFYDDGPGKETNFNDIVFGRGIAEAWNDRLFDEFRWSILTGNTPQYCLECNPNETHGQKIPYFPPEEEIAAHMLAGFSLADSMNILEGALRDSKEEAYSSLIHIMGLCHRMSGHLEYAKKYLDEALRIFPKNAKALLQRAKIAIEGKDFEEAIQLLKRAIELTPAAPHVEYLLAVALEGREDYGSALRHYRNVVQMMELRIYEVNEALLQVGSNCAHLFSRIVHCQMIMGDYENAVASLQKGITIDPDASYLLFESLLHELKDDPINIGGLFGEVLIVIENAHAEVLASLLAKRENGDDLAEQLKEEADRSEGERAWRLLYLVARYWKNRGEDRRALELYRRVVDSGGDGVGEVLRDMGACHLELGVPEAAKEYLERALAVSPDLEGVDYHLGILCERSGDTEGARVLYRETLKVDKDHRNCLMAVTRLSALSRAEGDLTSAQTWLERGESFRERSDSASKAALEYGWSKFFHEQGEVEEGLRHLRTAVGLTPHREDYWLELIEALGERGPAEGLLGEILLGTGDVHVEVLAWLLGRLESSVDLVERLEEEAERSEGERAWRLLYLVARYWKNGRQNNRALELYRRVVDAGGDGIGEVLRDMGECHLELGVPEAAKEYLERALAVSPDLEGVDYHLGILRERSGDTEGARARYLETFRVSKDHQNRLKAVTRLSSLSLAEGDLASAQIWLERGESFCKRSDSALKADLEYRWSTFFREKGKVEEGFRHLRTAVELAPNQEDYWIEFIEAAGKRGPAEGLLGEILLGTGDVHVEVLAWLIGKLENSADLVERLEEEAEGSEGEQAWRLLYLVARCRKNREENEHALELYRRVMVAGENSVGEVLRDMGECQLEIGDLEAAKESLERALGVSPELDWVHYHLGVVCEHRGDTEDAKGHYLETLKVSGDHQNCLMATSRLSALSMAEGDLASAQEWLKRGESFREPADPISQQKM